MKACVNLLLNMLRCLPLGDRSERLRVGMTADMAQRMLEAVRVMGTVCDDRWTLQKGTKEALQEFTIRVQLGRGSACADVWTSDLSYEYVRINAEYRT